VDRSDRSFENADHLLWLDSDYGKFELHDQRRVDRDIRGGSVVYQRLGHSRPLKDYVRPEKFPL